MLRFLKKVWDYLVEVFSHNEIRDTYSSEYKHEHKRVND